MKGLIFRELEKMGTELLGQEAWLDLVERAPLHTHGGLFVSGETYPDEDLLTLVGELSNVTGLSADALVRRFGRYIFRDLVALHPGFVKGGMGAKDFLMTVDRIIHVEVRKLHPGAVLPSFQYRDPAPDRLIMTYHSPRRLCDLASGLIDGVADHFRESIDQQHPDCMKRGDPACTFDLTFRR